MKGNKGLIVVAFVLLIMVFFLNYNYSLTADDWIYSRMADGSRINSFWDILVNQYHHYFDWGGRSVVHIIAQTLLYWGKPWSSIINSLAYLTLVTVIYKISDIEQKKKWTLFVLINIFIWFFSPGFGTTVLYAIGSANYMWGTLIIMLFLYSYVMAYLKPEMQTTNNYKRILFFVGGILAGWTNENMGAALIFLIIGFAFLLKIEKREIPQWFYWGLAGAIIGFVIMAIAPGNTVRYYYSVGDNYNKDLMGVITDRLINMFEGIKRRGFFVAVFYLIVLFVFMKNNKNRNTRVFRLSLLFFSAAIVAMMAMMGAPVFPYRTWFGIIIFMIIAIVVLLANIDYSTKLSKLSYATFLCVTISLFAVSYVLTLKDLIRIKMILQEREIQIATQKERGVKDIVIYGTFDKDNSRLVVTNLGDALSPLEQKVNIPFAKFHEVNSVTLIDTRTKTDKQQ